MIPTESVREKLLLIVQTFFGYHPAYYQEKTTGFCIAATIQNKECLVFIEQFLRDFVYNGVLKR